MRKRLFWVLEGSLLAALILLVLLWILGVADIEAWTVLVTALIAAVGFIFRVRHESDAPLEAPVDTSPGSSADRSDLSSADAARLIREASFALYLRDYWPGSRSDSREAVKELARELDDPFVLAPDLAHEALAAASELSESTPGTERERIRAMRAPVCERLPDLERYRIELQRIPAEVRDNLVRIEYGKARGRDDFRAWTYVLLAKEILSQETLLELLKDRLSRIDPYRGKKAYVETARLAKEELGEDEFPAWWEREIGNKP
jgi:hypothetical protein